MVWVGANASAGICTGTSFQSVFSLTLKTLQMSLKMYRIHDQNGATKISVMMTSGDLGQITQPEPWQNLPLTMCVLSESNTVSALSGYHYTPGLR